MLWGSDKNTISSNTFIRGGLETYYDSSHNTVFGNTINGKPLVYIEDESDITVNDAGQVIIIMCENITVQGLVLSNTSIGLQVRNSQECNIIGNTIFENSHGTAVTDSSQILIEGNTFRKNLWCGIGIYHDQGETEVLKNTVVNNRNGLYIFSCRNGVGIFNNNISSNNLGIDISSGSTSDCIVSGNEISNNNEGIKLKFSNNNIIYHNYNISCSPHIRYLNIIKNNNKNPGIDLETNGALSAHTATVITIRPNPITIPEDTLISSPARRGFGKVPEECPPIRMIPPSNVIFHCTLNAVLLPIFFMIPENLNTPCPILNVSFVMPYGSINGYLS